MKRGRMVRGRVERGRGRMRAWIVAAALFTAVGGAVACSSKADGSITAPKGAPYMSGRITSIVASGTNGGTVRIEANPFSTSQGLKAVARVDGVTIVLLPGNKPGDFRALAPGQFVRLWFDGVISESYPVQGFAATIAIDSLTIAPGA